MKVLKPINQRLASKMASEHKNLVGYIEESKTVFYGDDNQPVYEMIERSHPANEYKLVSYFGYLDVYEQEEDE